MCKRLLIGFWTASKDFKTLLCSSSKLIFHPRFLNKIEFKQLVKQLDIFWKWFLSEEQRIGVFYYAAEHFYQYCLNISEWTHSNHCNISWILDMCMFGPVRKIDSNEELRDVLFSTQIKDVKVFYASDYKIRIFSFSLINVMLKNNNENSIEFTQEILRHAIDLKNSLKSKFPFTAKHLKSV
jgi:hypothetical protein